MKRFRTSRTALPLLAALLLLLSACGAGGAPSGGSGGQAQQAEQTEQPSDSSSGAETLADLCGADYHAYLVETITMQMGNRMDKDPEVVYFPIAEDAPLTDYAAIDETTEFQVNEDGNLVILFPEGTVTDAANGAQSFIVPLP